MRKFRHWMDVWAGWVQRYPKSILSAYVFLFFGGLYLSLTSLGINTDLSDMISEDLEFHRLWKDYKQEFPYLNDTILVVIDSNRVEESNRAADWLVDKLQQSPDNFERVFRLNGGPFFQKYGALFQDEDDLEALGSYQQLSYAMSQRAGLETFTGFLSQLPINDRTEVLWKEVGESLKSRDQIDILARPQADTRQFVEIFPQLNYSQLLPAEQAIQELRLILDEYESGGVDFRITGVAALGYEELQSVSAGAGVAGVLSLILVGFILFLTLRSSKLIFVSLSTLILGLVLTAGFAALSIGHLNLISVAFAVLFIGLGIDYSIHICLRYRELCQAGDNHAIALRQTTGEMGASLFLCTLTTSAGFFAFVPTSYAGISELGIIAGVGMLINFVIHMSFFPALLCLLRPAFKTDLDMKSSAGSWISKFSFHHYKTVRIGAALLALLALPFALKVSFDPNPLNLQDPNTEAFKTYQALLSESDRSPWTIKIVEKEQASAEKTVTQLKELPEVSQVIWLDSFVPEDQEHKYRYLSSLNWPDTYQVIESPTNVAWASFEALVNSLERKAKPADQAEGELLRILRSFREEYGDQKEEGVKILNGIWLRPVVENLQQLPLLMPDSTLSIESLPDQIKDRYLSPSGAYRLEVFPTENLNDIEAMREFSKAVKSVASGATDDPVTLPLSGDAVVEAFVQATLLAFVLIILLTWVVTKSFRDSIFVMLPLIFTGIALMAGMSLAGLSFNFANVIVLPLLLGIGVDSGIHLLHRLRLGRPEDSLRGSTARAVFFSAITTISSFGTLAISSHRGTASMGFLLTIGTILVMLSTLSLIPALIRKRSIG